MPGSQQMGRLGEPSLPRIFRQALPRRSRIGREPFDSIGRVGWPSGPKLQARSAVSGTVCVPDRHSLPRLRHLSKSFQKLNRQIQNPPPVRQPRFRERSHSTCQRRLPFSGRRETAWFNSREPSPRSRGAFPPRSCIPFSTSASRTPSPPPPKHPLTKSRYRSDPHRLFCFWGLLRRAAGGQASRLSGAFTVVACGNHLFFNFKKAPPPHPSR